MELSELVPKAPSIHDLCHRLYSSPCWQWNTRPWSLDFGIGHVICVGRKSTGHSERVPAHPPVRPAINKEMMMEHEAVLPEDRCPRSGLQKEDTRADSGAPSLPPVVRSWVGLDPPPEAEVPR
ncbi:unnamed protein product [Rangifer tarandus platyrhynchus]|uniref:Uncharacterized protein n=2 Tax=Rangifer tarandus platyrhynchus TaxID=3082113 RepID=A0ACB0F8E5_RANTA|nr:unnamed protein product [Rangifer tarandus platyrhynchus]CAI9709260.1 unnamed protein product [Rangifer tarandus platyrhynchus]